MEIKRYSISSWCGCSQPLVLAADGYLVDWSDVEPLLKNTAEVVPLRPLADEQVRQLAHQIVRASRDRNDALGQVRDERAAKELTWKEADAAGSAAHAAYIEDCRAALKEVGRG